MSLSEYSRKRDFRKTPEPAPKEVKAGKSHSGRFFVQRHNASRLHYDFRLEIDGVLKSWAVPKGPSLDPEVKHLAAMVEDHPIDYGDFEGNIPKGEYGGGSVMLWDCGTFELIGEESAMEQIARGDLKFRLHGNKLHGAWAIVLMKGRGKGNEWLLIKKKDEAAQTPFDIDKLAWSVKTGRTQDEIAANAPDPPASSQMPEFFEPMGATLTDAPPKGKDWIFEVKWDGIRALVYIDRGTLRIYTRNQNRCEDKYPELLPLPKYIRAAQAILDGEIVVLDEKGVSRFELTIRHEKPAHLILFDLLYLDGRDLRREPLSERKKLLEKIVKPWTRVRISESFEGHGEHLLDAAREAGLEGLMAKKTSSVYESKRSANWLKLKLTTEQEFVIGGYTPGEREHFGSLAIGFYEDEQLHYAGNVGTGFDQATINALWKKLEQITTSKRPFVKGDKIPKGTVWVEPKLVAEVRFANWTADRKLRAPVYVGLREDKPAAKVESEMRFTHLDKIYYPKDGYTKGDLVNYYDQVAPLLLPYLKDRPLSLKRYPDGIHGEYFFQKNTPDTYPAFLKTETIGDIRYVLAQDKRSLMYLVNLGCIDQNPWMSRIGSLDKPDYILIDLDPQGCEYPKIVEAALLVKEKLDAIGLKGYPKTTGGDGMHVFIPIKAEYSYETARHFAEVIARMLAAERPDLFTTPRSVEKREKNKVYFDYMQIAESKTISAPYVARAYDGAPVSTPLRWDELTPELRPSQFDIRNAPERFQRVGDLFAGVLRHPQALEKAFGKLEKLVGHQTGRTPPAKTV
jgi:bifunctional non-homologous end joining protein LigD